MRPFLALGLLALGSSTLACFGTGSEDAAEHGAAIVGGVEAASGLDAVGALGRVKADGSFAPYCTATLIAPRLVLTAKHCASSGPRPYTESEPIHFAVGNDTKSPEAIVKVARTWMAPTNEGGFIGRGTDVAIMSLEAPIERVAPLAIANDHVDPSVVGSRLSAVGYGYRDRARTLGQRRVGTLTVRATRGPVIQGVFATVEDVLDFVRTEGGEAFAPGDEARVRDFWTKTLFEDHEIFVGVAPGDAQPCSGDSGGPLVARVKSGLAVFGVVSGSFKLTNSSFNPCSVVGELYATFPREVQTMIDEAAATVDAGPKRVEPSGVFPGSSVAVPDVGDGGDPCGGVPVEGRCEDAVALRCVASSEGPPHVTRTDCSLLLQTCGASGDGGAAECVER